MYTSTDNKITFEVKVKGHSVKVEHDPVSYGLVVHFALHSPLVSNTGFKSHFMYREELYVQKFNQNYTQAATELAEYYMQEMIAENPRLLQQQTQLSLF